jgi:AcrR family transcriptional regulator
MSATRRRLAPRDDLAPAILGEAATLFAERGYEATTMQEIATRVGITAPGLYYYFPSKQRLLFEVLHTALAGLVSRLERAVEVARAEGLTAQLRALIQVHVAFQVEEAAESAVYGSAFYGSKHMLNALTAKQRGRLAELQDRSYRLLRDILQRGVEAGVFRIPAIAPTAMAIYGMGEHVPAWFKTGGPLSTEAVAALYADLAIRMAGARPAPG